MNFSGDFSVFYPRNSILNFTFFFTCLKIKNPLFVEILGGGRRNRCQGGGGELQYDNRGRYARIHCTRHKFCVMIALCTTRYCGVKLVESFTYNLNV